jgi:hypothetical protein
MMLVTTVLLVHRDYEAKNTKVKVLKLSFKT